MVLFVVILVIKRREAEYKRRKAKYKRRKAKYKRHKARHTRRVRFGEGISGIQIAMSIL
jgi:hypothetical protein